MSFRRKMLDREILTFFPTRIYRARIDDAADLNADLEAEALAIAEEDLAGQAWSRENGYKGYTSYASLDDLPLRAPAFATLKRKLDRHVKLFAEDLKLELGPRGRLVLDSLWINVLRPGGVHTGHIHPHSVVSGTYYVTVPDKASALKIEDPRLPLMMAHPPKREDADDEDRTFVYLAPEPGMVLLWESFLRHEVPMNRARSDRLSVSFNYKWG